MYKKVINILLTIIAVSIILGCQFQEIEENPSLSEIHWEDLQITPQAEDALCWDLSLSGESPDWEEMKQSFQSGLLMGMSSEGISDVQEIGYQTYRIKPNQPIEAKLRLWYPEQNTSPATIRFFALLNEKQLPNVFPSDPYYKDIIIPIGNETILELNIPPLAEGTYDFIVIGIPYIDNYPTPEGIVRILSQRITLVAGEPSTPFRQISFSTLPPEGLQSKGDPKISLSLSLAKDAIKAWNAPEQWLPFQLGDPLDFFILASHEEVTNLDAKNLSTLDTSFFSIVLFMDYEQIEISKSQISIYGKVNKNTAYTRMPVEVTLPSSAGKHYILALRINSPGVPMCILWPPPGGRILPFDIIGILVGIDVLPATSE